MVQSLQAALLSLLPAECVARFQETKAGFTVYFFEQKMMEFVFKKSKQFVKIASEAGVKGPGDTRPFQHIPFQDASVIEQQAPLILAAYAYAKENEKVEEFGCCHDFVACSDARQCIHADDPENRGCVYRKNLEAGRIFYGKNCNVKDE